MATSTQFNPNRDLNARLLAAGVSKTVYALVTPETESVKDVLFGDHGSEGRREYLAQFRGAWTAKQDRYHEEFFETWHAWSKPLVELDRAEFPFYYPTAGASEPIRQLIFDLAALRGGIDDAPCVHVFEGEYEGYKAMAEAAGLDFQEHRRADYATVKDQFLGRAEGIDLFFISQPSAIDGNVWAGFNAFLETMPRRSVVVDLTYVGAVLSMSRFNMNHPSVKDVVFSLSKPFGCYYDRIGGVFCREENPALFGNKWFKGLTGIALGTLLMKHNDVFAMPTTYTGLQRGVARDAAVALGLKLRCSDVFILATAEPDESELSAYLLRAGRARLCLTPAMAKSLGTAE